MHRDEGTRGAAKNWELDGFIPGVTNPCSFHHPQRELRVLVHGDDFVGLGSLPELQLMNHWLAKHWA